MIYDLSLLIIVNQVSNTAFNIGEFLERWIYDLDDSLLKKEIRPLEVRTIGTLYADFNQIALLDFSKLMMGLGIKRGAIPSSQYARKGNRSIEATLVKIMVFDQLRFNKTNDSFIVIDLKNCFNRMAYPISYLATQRLGVHSSMYDQNSLLNKTFIRTAYGDSIWLYTDESNRPLQGVVQGNGAATPISCVILTYLQSKAIGVYFISAISLSVFSIIAILYVDDPDILITAIQKDESISSIVKRTQKAAAIYQLVVHQIGGAVRRDRCRWYLIQLQWKQDKWSYLKNKNKHIKNYGYQSHHTTNTTS